MAKRKVRIYKTPQGKGEHKSKLKNFLFIAQQGAQVNQQQAMMDKVLSYVYNAILNQEEDPEDVYESLLKMKLDKNTASDVIEYVLQGIQNEGAARETVARPTSKEEEAEQVFAAEEARREEEDEVLMDQIMMDEGPDLQDPELEEQLFQQQKGGIRIGEKIADKRGYDLANIESDYWQDDTRNEPIKSIFDPRYRKYRGINKYNKDIISKHNRFIDKARDAYDDRWSVVKNYTDSTEWMKSPQYLNFTKYSEDKRLKDLKLPKSTPGHKFKDKKINRAWGATDWDANKRDEVANYAKKLPRNRTYTTDEKLNEYLEWAKQKDPEYFKKNNIEKLLGDQKKSNRFNNQVLRSIIADQGLMPESEKEVIEETPIMNEVVIDSPAAPQEQFVYEPTVIPEIPTMDLDPQAIPLDMQQFEMEEMDMIEFSDPKKQKRPDRNRNRSRTPRVIVDKGRRRSNRGRFKFEHGGEIQNTMFNIENKLTDSKGDLMNTKQYVKKHLKDFQPGGAQGTAQNDENSPWTVNQETWKRNDKTKALVNYSQNNVAKEQEKKRLEQEHAQLMAQREQLGNFIPQGGEEMIDMTSMQEQLPEAQYGGMGARRMIPRGFGISPLNVKNIDVRRTGLFGRPKEYSMEIAPFDYALLAANPLLRSIYNIDALTPSVISGKKTVIDYQPIKKAIKEIENKEKEKEDTEEVVEVPVEEKTTTEVSADNLNTWQKKDPSGASEDVIGNDGEVVIPGDLNYWNERIDSLSEQGYSKEEIYKVIFKDESWESYDSDDPGGEKMKRWLDSYPGWRENTMEEKKIRAKEVIENTEETEETDGSEEVIEEEEENVVVKNQPDVKVKVNEKGQIEDSFYTGEGVEYDNEELIENMSSKDILNNMQDPRMRNQYLSYLKESTGKTIPFDFPNEAKIQEFLKFQELQKKQSDQDKINKMYNVTNVYNAPTISEGFVNVPLSIEEKMRREQLELEVLRRTNPGAYNLRNDLNSQQHGGFTDEESGLTKFIYGGDEDMYKEGGFPDLNNDGRITQADILKGRGVYEYGGEMEDIPMAQRGQRFIRRDRRKFNRNERQQARGRGRAFRGANKMLRNQMRFPTMSQPRGMNHLFSSNPAFGYAGSWSKPVSGFYNKKTNTPWEGQLSPDAQIKNIDVTKSGIFGRPKRYSITYGQKTGDLVKKQQTPMITMNNNQPNQTVPSVMPTRPGSTVPNNNQGNSIDPRFDASQVTASNLNNTPLEYGSPTEWANRVPQTMREEYESQGIEMPSSVLSQAEKVWNPITNNWEGEAVEVDPELLPPPGYSDEMGVTINVDRPNNLNPETEEEVDYGPDGGGFVEEQPDWATDDDFEYQYGGCSTCPKYNFGGMTLGDETMMNEDEIAAYMRAGGVVEFI